MRICPSLKSLCLSFACVASLLGCTDNGGTALQADIDSDGVLDTLPPDTVDLREDFNLPDDDDFLVLEMADLFIPSGEERIFCKGARWEGPDVGVISLYPLRSPDFDHHVIVRTPQTLDGDVGPEGEVYDCTTMDGPQFTAPGMFSPVTLPDARPSKLPGQDWVRLPEGLAFSLENDQAFFGEVHYINPTTQPILVNAAFVMGLIPDDEVEAYVGVFNHEAPRGYSVPPGGEYHLQFDCVWEESASILSLGGHMHDYGVSFFIDWNSESGSEEVYSVPTWWPQFEFAPPVMNWRLGEFVVEAGDSFTTHCRWDNPGDEPLEFPTEMCSTYGVASPLSKPTLCEGTVMSQPPR